jgi:hypothetical protein
MPWPYCKPAKCRLYVDPRVLRGLLADDGTDLPDALVDTSSLLAEALAVGASEIDQACQSQRKWDWTNLKWLAAVPGDGDEPTHDYLADNVTLRPDQGATLRRLNAALALGFLQARRARPEPENTSIASLATWARGMIDRLVEGHDVFMLAGNLDAGLPDKVTCRPVSGDRWINNRMFPDATLQKGI